MTTVIHRNAGRFDGIWLLDSFALQEFDQIVQEEWNHLRRKTEQKIDQQVESEFRSLSEPPEKLSNEPVEEIRKKLRDKVRAEYPFSRNMNEPELTVVMKSGQKFQTSSFKEVIQNPAAQNQMPDKFSLSMRTETVDCDIGLDDNTMSIRVSPEEVQESGTIFLKFEQWAQKSKCPKWCYYWKFMGRLMIFGLLVLLVSVTANFGINKPGEQYIQLESKRLLQDGISNEEIPKALELILLSVSKNIPKEASYEIKPWFRVFMVIIVIGAIISLFPPTSRIGIGKGQKSVQKQKTWLRLVTISIPTFVIMGVLASVVGSLLFGALK